MSVKIINITHKRCFLPVSSDIITVHAGRSVAQEESKDGVLKESDFFWLLDNTLGDDSGDNISELNRYYNEMTAIYWVWKNYDKIGNPDSVGFMHYRRHFMLNEGISLSNDYLKILGLTHEILNSVCSRYDLITPHFMKINKGKFIDRIGPEFCVAGGDKIKEAIRITLDIIKEKSYSDYRSILNVFEGNQTGSFCNMFIMKKALFFEYCEWIFPILFELDKRLGRDYGKGEERCIGWTAEMMTSVFIYLKSKIVSHKVVAVFLPEHAKLRTYFELFILRVKCVFGKKSKKKKYEQQILNAKLLSIMKRINHEN